MQANGTHAGTGAQPETPVGSLTHGGMNIDKDVVRRALTAHYRPGPGGGGPSWLTFLGHTKDRLWNIDPFCCEPILLKSHWVLHGISALTMILCSPTMDGRLISGSSISMTSRAFPTHPARTLSLSDSSGVFAVSFLTTPYSGMPLIWSENWRLSEGITTVRVRMRHWMAARPPKSAVTLSHRPLLGIAPLLRDQLPMPGKQHTGGHQRLRSIKCMAPQHLGLHGQSYPLLVGKAKPLSFELLLKHRVLFHARVDDRLLLSVKPTCHNDNQHMERLHANRFLSTGWFNDINWIVFSSPLIVQAGDNWLAGGVVVTLVGVIMSSRSDWKTIQPANKILVSLGISHEVRIISPRKKSDKLRQYAESAAKRGIKVIIACEGDSVNISNELVSATSLPVLGVIGQPKEPGAGDSLFSSGNASAATPVCALSHGQEGAKNAALLAANMLAEIDPSLGKSTSRYLRQADAASSSPGLSTAA